MYQKITKYIKSNWKKIYIFRDIIYRSSRCLCQLQPWLRRGHSRHELINVTDLIWLLAINAPPRIKRWWQCLRRRPEQLIRHKNGRNLKTRSDETNVRMHELSAPIVFVRRVYFRYCILIFHSSGTGSWNERNANQYTTCPNKWICD